MCGVVGYYPINPSRIAAERFAVLLRESTIRGLHAFGLCALAPEDAPRIDRQNNGFREQIDSGFTRTKAFCASDLYAQFDPEVPTIAHARYSTSGDWQNHDNNQPIVIERRALVFNGVIHMGTREEFNEAFAVNCETDNDGEIFLRLMDRMAPLDALLSLTGSFAGLWFDRNKGMYAGRNPRRPLWKCEAFGAKWYASTQNIFVRSGFPTPIPVEIGVERV